jgi:hypothetical protein
MDNPLQLGGEIMEWYSSYQQFRSKMSLLPSGTACVVWQMKLYNGLWGAYIISPDGEIIAKGKFQTEKKAMKWCKENTNG